jgi:methionyl-tRNA synthetase
MPEKSQQIWKAIGISRSIEKTSFDNEKQFYLPDDIATIDKIAPVFPRIEA